MTGKRKTAREMGPFVQSRERRRTTRPDHVEDIINTGLNRVPGANPRAREHSDVSRCIQTITGDTVVVMLGRTVDGYQDVSGFHGVRNVFTIQSCPVLWEGEDHVLLTHALRFFKLASFELKSTPSHRKIMEGAQSGKKTAIHPSKLLVMAGANEVQARRIVSDLQSLELVTHQQFGVFHVVKNIHAVTADGRLLRRDELIDGWGFVDDIPVNSNNASKEVQQVADSTSLTVDRATRHEVLELAYAALLELVPEGLSADEYGWFRFRDSSSICEVLQRQLGVSVGQAKSLMHRLTLYGATFGITGGQGKHPRNIKAGMTFPPMPVPELRFSANSRGRYIESCLTQLRALTVYNGEGKFTLQRDVYVRCGLAVGLTPDQVYQLFEGLCTAGDLLIEEHGHELLFSGSVLPPPVVETAVIPDSSHDFPPLVEQSPATGDVSADLLLEALAVSVAGKDAADQRVTELEGLIADLEGLIAERDQTIEQLRSELASRPAAYQNVQALIDKALQGKG